MKVIFTNYTGRIKHRFRVSSHIYRLHLKWMIIIMDDHNNEHLRSKTCSMLRKRLDQEEENSDTFGNIASYRIFLYNDQTSLSWYGNANEIRYENHPVIWVFTVSCSTFLFFIFFLWGNIYKWVYFTALIPSMIYLLMNDKW